uniref:Uncharacterized protein n=1 Tax=Arundo donax TaxID=35708 RepID=A0A0A9B6Y8_ARUDO
MYRVSLRPA